MENGESGKTFGVRSFYTMLNKLPYSQAANEAEAEKYEEQVR
jgi:hypothetical protein